MVWAYYRVILVEEAQAQEILLMVSSRPYRTGLPVEEAIRRLHVASGTQFDPAVISSFVPLAQSEMASVLEAVGVAESSAFSP